MSVPAGISARHLVAALADTAKLLNRYTVRSTLTGALELLCDICGKDDDVYGHVIWSTANRGRQNYTLIECANLAFDHEYMVHRKEANNNDPTDTGSAESSSEL